MLANASSVHWLSSVSLHRGHAFGGDREQDASREPRRDVTGIGEYAPQDLGLDTAEYRHETAIGFDVPRLTRPAVDLDWRPTANSGRPFRPSICSG